MERSLKKLQEHQDYSAHSEAQLKGYNAPCCLIEGKRCKSVDIRWNIA